MDKTKFTLEKGYLKGNFLPSASAATLGDTANALERKCQCAVQRILYKRLFNFAHNLIVLNKYVAFDAGRFVLSENLVMKCLFDRNMGWYFFFILVWFKILNFNQRKNWSFT